MSPSVDFPYAVRRGRADAAVTVQRNLEYLAEKVSASGAATFINVKDSGAKGDGTTDDTAAIATAVGKIPAGGGVLLFPPGTYVGSLSITVNKKILVLGYGATIKPPASGVGVSVQATNGDTAVGQVIEGLTIDGANGSVTGIRVTNTDRVCIRSCRVDDCTIGIELKSDAGGWVEMTVIEDTVTSFCATGLKFNKTASGAGSFGETALLSAGFQGGAIGIEITSGAVLYRSFLHFTVWIENNQTCVKNGGDLSHSYWFGGMESFGSTNTVGWENTSTCVSPYLAHMHLNWAGTFTSRITNASGKILRYYQGSDLFEKGAWPMYRMFKDGDTWARLQIDVDNVPGLSFGGGSGSADASIWRNSAEVLKTDGLFAADQGLVTFVKGSDPVDGDFPTAVDGTIAGVYDGMDYWFFIRLNGTWRKVQLT